MLRSQHSRTLDKFEKVTAMEPSAGYDDSRHEEAPFVVAYSVAECSDGGQNSSAHEPCMGRRGREDSVPHVTDDDNAQKPNREVCAMLISTGTMVAISASDDAGAVRHGVRVDTKAAEPTSQIESSTPGGLSEPSLLETISETIDDGGGGNKVESPRKPPAASKQQQRGKQPPIGTKLDQRTALGRFEVGCMESYNDEHSTLRGTSFAQESDSGNVQKLNPEVCAWTPSTVSIRLSEAAMNPSEPTSQIKSLSPGLRGSGMPIPEATGETPDASSAFIPAVGETLGTEPAISAHQLAMAKQQLVLLAEETALAERKQQEADLALEATVAELRELRAHQTREGNRHAEAISQAEVSLSEALAAADATLQAETEKYKSMEAIYQASVLASERDNDAIDGSLTCPITFDLFVEPVVTPSGFVYERSAIEQHIARSGTDPQAPDRQLAATELGSVIALRHIADVRRAEQERRNSASRRTWSQSPLPTSPPAPATEPHATEAATEQLRSFVAALGLRPEQQHMLLQLLDQNEIGDLDTMRMLEARDWIDMGVKIGTRRKILARLAAAR